MRMAHRILALGILRVPRACLQVLNYVLVLVHPGSIQGRVLAVVKGDQVGVVSNQPFDGIQEAAAKR